MHQHFSRTVVAFYLAVHTNRSIALKTEKLKFYCWVDRTVTDHFWFLGELSAFMLVLETVVVMGLVTRNTKIGVFCLTILPSDVVFT